MGEVGRLPVALRGDGRRWSTVPAERSVLGVVHNITSATRLLDLLSVFENDERVQVFFSCTGSSALDEGTGAFLTAHGMLHLPWSEAVSRSFDIAVATSRGGDLDRLRCPVVFAPHGAGYNKRLGREGGAFGLTDEWLVHEGRLLPAALALSHTEQLDRLAEGCPRALPIAQVVGDPVLDQLSAGRAFRAVYREALGLLPGQRLVVVSSTWGHGSVLGSPRTGILRRALAELPADEFRVLAAVHPNAWYGHGAWQLRTWLASLVDAGLVLPAPETEVWKAALCAADFLIGDHGSLTLYGVALGVPCLLGAFRDPVVAPGSPMRRLRGLVPGITGTRPLSAQLAHAADTQRDDGELAALRRSVTSEPGKSAALVRRLLYSRLSLPEPPYPAATRAVPVPSVPSPRAGRLPHLPATLVSTAVNQGGRDPEISLRRFPAALQQAPHDHLAAAHLTADPDDPDRRWPRSAEVLLLPHTRYPYPDAVRWSDFAARFPGCALIAVEETGHGCTVLLGDDTRLRAHWADRPAWASFDAAASAVHAWTRASPAEIRTQDALRLGIHAGEGLPPALVDVVPLH
ncbi:hypothetical protein [Streptomyces sp. NPDC017095]|uniref:hypothetical protein n=1 Tax=Streptomyces sp. NPDC017095 TaxID=3364977 RepID=UPI0037981ED2